MRHYPTMDTSAANIYMYTHSPLVWLPMKREKANIIPTKAVNTVARPFVCVYLFGTVYDRHSALCKSVTLYGEKEGR